MTNLYDQKNAKSIEKYARRLIGKTFMDVINESIDDISLKQAIIKKFGNPSHKGGLGNLLEVVYFGYKANSKQEPDFKEAGVELKVTPYEKNINGAFRAGERLVITMIGYDRPIELDFFNSDVWHKIKSILLIYYWRNRMLQFNLYYSIDFVKLFSPIQADLKIMQEDFQKITKMIAAGRAHELSESDTLYLGACTKGSTAAKSLVSQYYSKSHLAPKRAFCLKSSYMTYVLNNYVTKNVDDVESIVENTDRESYKTFEELIIDMINRHVGKTDVKLCAELDREYNNNKSQWIELSYRMLGIKSNRAEEFIKANIVVKAIRIEADGRMRESMSLPSFKFIELSREKWNDSQLYNYFEETRFLFVVFKHNGLNYELRGCKLWNMPASDLNEIVYKGWEDIKRIVVQGVEFKRCRNKSGFYYENNLPAKNNNDIVHVRPHAQKSAYKFSDGFVSGNLERDANQLPDGQWMTTQSMWLNNNYILKQIADMI